MSHDDFFAELGIQRDGDAGSATDKPKSRKQRRMEKVERRQRKRRRHRLTSIVIVATLVAVGIVGYKAIGIMRDASAQATHAEDYRGNGEGEVTVTIPEGASGLDIGDILHGKGVVASGKAFTNAVKNNPKGNTIQPGTYKLKKKMSANAALQALLDPETKSDHTLTVSAGNTKQIIKDRLKQVSNFTDEQIEAAYADTASIGLPAEAGGNVEGWLAPGTYDVTENATPTDLVKQMVSRTVNELNELKVPKENYQTVLTKASIVERSPRTSTTDRWLASSRTGSSRSTVRPRASFRWTRRCSTAWGAPVASPPPPSSRTPTTPTTPTLTRGFRPVPSAALVRAPSRPCSIRRLEAGSTS